MKNKYLTEKERYQIEAWRREKISVAKIARNLGKCERTIYYELKRGTVELLGKDMIPYKMYCADVAQRKTEEKQKNKGPVLKAAGDMNFVKTVETLICRYKCSPYVVSCMLCGMPDITRVCPVTIYNYISRGFLKNITQNDMPYRKRKQKYKKVKRISRKNVFRPLIDDRPEEILKRLDFGHWEMDTVYSGHGKGKACLLVLTERKSRYELLLKMQDKTAISTVQALDDLEKFYGSENFSKTFKTITCDNGSEFDDYEGIVKNGRTKLYYCHPYCSSERGSNENQNKLVRRFIPKGENIGKYSDQEINAMCEWINLYPRKLFGGLSSIEYIQNAQEEFSKLIGSDST